MKKIKVVIGANFGDEGKGLMTDAFCSSFPNEENVLNVRFNGTCQAGHTVVKGDKRHVFSHFGAGSFNSNVTTFLTSDFYVNPILFNEEYEKLEKLGITPKVIISKDAFVITFFDMLYNRVIETSRGENRHGSCGMGLWESVLRGNAKYGFKVEDLSKSPLQLKELLLNIRDGYFENKFKKDNIVFDETIEDVNWYNSQIIDSYIYECKKMLDRVILSSDKEVLSKFDNIVFEGAQGLLLDWNNREYMPYLTASRTGVFNVNKVLKLIDADFDLEICYVTRSYFTRHGNGIFKTEVENKEVLGLSQEDKTNFLNPWQGVFRYGYFDEGLFKKSILKDLQDLDFSKVKKSICVTHLNETQNRILTQNGEMTLSELLKDIGDSWHIYTSIEETRVSM